MEVSKATLVVSLHPRGVRDARVKNDIKFKSSLNKKSLSQRHARENAHTLTVALFTRPKTLKVKYSRRPAGFSIINFNVVPDKNAKSHGNDDNDGDNGEEKAMPTDDLFREERAIIRGDRLERWKSRGG